MAEFDRVYIDSSVIVRLALAQPGSLRHVRWEEAVSSELIVVEVLRTLDHLRLTGRIDAEELARLREAVDASLAGIDLIQFQPAIFKRATSAFSTPLRTLDALHLATALVWADYVGANPVFLTHERQLAVSARACGLAVHP